MKQPGFHEMSQGFLFVAQGKPSKLMVNEWTTSSFTWQSSSATKVSVTNQLEVKVTTQKSWFNKGLVQETQWVFH